MSGTQDKLSFPLRTRNLALKISTASRERIEKVILSKWSRKQGSVKNLISDKINFHLKLIRRDAKSRFVSIRGTVNQKTLLF